MKQLAYANMVSECYTLETMIAETPADEVITRKSLEWRLQRVREKMEELMTEPLSVHSLNNWYFDWLRDKTVLREIDNGWTEITTPFLDRRNDCLQIYAKPENGMILLTDDGYVISDLRICGCDLDSPKQARQAQGRRAGRASARHV